MAYNISLPQLNGLSEKEQLAQMRTYLYQQAEVLQFALNDLESGRSVTYGTPKSLQSKIDAAGIFGAIKGLITNSDDIAEACYKKFAEHGTAEGWTYIKLLGGTYEMYGVFEVTPTSSELNGTLYRTNDIEVPTPFEITDDAVVTGMGAENYILTNGVYANANAISIRIMCDKEIGTTDPIKVRLNVIGTYAQTEV